ncbi:MAG: hydantoinase/oxoprolinase family protein [Halanaerobiaceae bacterium]
MKLGLGIDAGGTYTDSVIYNFENEEIIEKAKSRTVKSDLKIGINKVLDKLSEKNLTQAKMVSLSTTLATNAAVEDKMGQGGLILIGCDESTVKRKGKKYGLPSFQDIIFLKGGHNQQGEVKAEPDWELLQNHIQDYGKNVEGWAVVQKWGMRNPEFEKKAKNIIEEKTGLPAICAHELLGDLNFLKRASTTLLNVRLIPIINKFMNAIKTILKKRNISAPLVMVRGDGSLMSEEYARKKPLETLLSGPAASTVGGINITGERNAVIVDMGGTTTDLALVKEGRPGFARGGIEVGEWITGTKSILLKTIGLGGDSRINLTKYNQITLGPERVAPLSWLANKNPEVLKEIKRLKEKENAVVEFWYKLKDISRSSNFTDRENNIVKALESGPLSREKLAEEVNLSVYDLRLGNLKKNEIIMRSCLTPTDIMHLQDIFTEWDREAAFAGAEAIIKEMNISIEEFIKLINSKIREKIYYNIVTMLLEYRDENLIEDSHHLQKVIHMVYRDYMENTNSTEKYILPDFKTDYSLIGIGAPIHVFLPEVAEVMHTEALIPKEAPVANAVGAVTGNISVEEEVRIKPVYNVDGISFFNCFSSNQRKKFNKYDKALEWAQKEAKVISRKKAEQREAGQINTFVEIDEDKQNDVILEIKVTARSIGNIRWI